MPPVAYRPSLVVHLTIRFDEDIMFVESPPVDSVDARLDAVLASAGAPPTVVMKPLVVDGAAEFPGVSRFASRPTQIGNQTPLQGSIELNGYKDPHKFNFTFDFRSLPIDPRLVRSAAVEVHLGTVSDDDFAEGMTRTRRDGTRASILRTLTVDGKPNPATLLFAGVVDTWKAVYDADAGQTAEIEGRDLRGLFADTKVRPDLFRLLNLRQPIPEVVAQILRLHPSGVGFRIVVNDDDWTDANGNPIPPPSPWSAQSTTPVRGGAKGTKAHAKPSGNPDKINFWTLIMQYCRLVGAVPYFEGYDLHIRPARSIWTQAKKAGIDPSIPTPFNKPFPGVERTVGEESLVIRRVVFGEGIQKLEIDRKLGGQKMRPVEIVSLNTGSNSRVKDETGRPGQLVVATWPPTYKKKARASGVAPSGIKQESDVVRISIPGIASKERALALAQDIYEEMNRHEMHGNVETKWLGSFGGDNDDPDILRLKPGDPIEFRVNTRSLQSKLPFLAGPALDQMRLPFDEAVRQIEQQFERAGQKADRNLARVLAATARNMIAQLQFFRVKNVKYTWDHDDGVNVTFDFETYLAQRHDVLPTQFENRQRPRSVRV